MMFSFNIMFYFYLTLVITNLVVLRGEECVLFYQLPLLITDFIMLKITATTRVTLGLFGLSKQLPIRGVGVMF